MPKRKLSLDPNDTSLDDPQFGNVEDLPPGVKRQTSYCILNDVWDENNPTYSRLVFTFPECLGVEETLNNTAKDNKCIPTLNMDIPINLPVVKDCRVDLIQGPPDYVGILEKNTAGTGVYLKKSATNLTFILTGNDQLKKKAPDVDDETKETDVKDVTQEAALSDAIWAKYLNVPTPQSSSNFTTAIKPAGWTTNDYWIYGKDVGGAVALAYDDVAKTLMRSTENQNNIRTEFTQNNILSRGYLLLKDHVNMFIRVQHDGSAGDTPAMKFRIILDYTTRKVSLSSLLVWRQQISEFLPKQIQWRVYNQAVSTGDKKNGWNILVSRGTVKESGTGTDPTDKTQFPDIKD